jgi:hypothetical protein
MLFAVISGIAPVVGPEREVSMKRRFLSVVPKAVQHWAVAIVAAGVLIGLVVGYRAAGQGDLVPGIFAAGGAGLAGSVLVATWLLCLGFVFADARQRAMPPVLWTLVAMLVPNLLGFLLYFAIRKPLTVACPGCGRAIPMDQPFCSWCGSARLRPPSADTPHIGPSGLDSVHTASVHDAP